MSEDQWGRRPGPGEPPYGRDDDARRRPPNPPDDATRVTPSSPDDATRTQPVRPDGATRVPPNHPDGVDDRTRPMPRSNDRGPSDRTSIMPPVGGAPEGNAPWAGRAEVRAPRAEPYGADPYGPGATSDWSAGPPSEPRGKWWLPIVIGIVGLVLLALLGWGIYLIAQHQDDDTPATTPTPTVAPASTVTAATTAPTTAAPTTAAPTTTAPSPEEVTVPALKGLSQDAAQQALSRRGLSARLKFRASTEAPPGTVIDSDPAEGQEVPPDSVVTLFIASASPSPSVSSSSATPQPDDD
jgi:hypothetical protein